MVLCRSTRPSRTNTFLIKVKEESEKASFKLNIQKSKIMASGSITLWQLEGGKWKQ